MTHNQIDYHNALETERHNKMMEKETRRHQKRDEALREQANAIQEEANRIQERQVAINELHLARSDEETQRSNIAREQLTAAANYIQSALAKETSRHNTAMEWINRSLNSSTIQKNIMESNVASANIGLIQEKTRTQKEQTRLIRNQATTETYKQGESGSRKKLNEAQTSMTDTKEQLSWYDTFWHGFSAIKFW